MQTATAPAHLATVTSYYGCTRATYERQPDGTYDRADLYPGTPFIEHHRGFTLAQLVAPGMATDANGDDLDEED